MQESLFKKNILGRFKWFAEEVERAPLEQLNSHAVGLAVQRVFEPNHEGNYLKKCKNPHCRPCQKMTLEEQETNDSK